MASFYLCETPIVLNFHEQVSELVHREIRQRSSIRNGFENPAKGMISKEATTIGKTYLFW